MGDGVIEDSLLFIIIDHLHTYSLYLHFLYNKSIDIYISHTITNIYLLLVDKE